MLKQFNSERKEWQSFIDPDLLRLRIQAQLRAIDKNDFKTFDLIQTEKQNDREFLTTYLGLEENHGKQETEEDKRRKLNSEYEGKGLDQSRYLEFWQDFNTQNPEFSTERKTKSELASTLPSISQRRSSVQEPPQPSEDAMFTGKAIKIKQATQTQQVQQPSTDTSHDEAHVRKLETRIQKLEKTLNTERITNKLEIKQIKTKSKEAFEAVLR